MDFPGGSGGKESAYNAGDPCSIPGSERSPGVIEWPPTPVFLPGEFHARGACMGYVRTEEPGGLQSTESQRIPHD